MVRPWIVVAALFFGATASAHPITTPKRDALFIAPDGVRIVVDYLVPGEDSRILREMMKGDRSRIEKYLLSQAMHFVSLRVDGELQTLVKENVLVDLGKAPMDALGIRFTLQTRLSLGGRSHKIHFEDRHKDRKITVPVTVEVAPGLTTDLAVPQPVVFEGHPLDFTIR